MKTLIKNGRVVTAVDDYRADIFTRGKTMTTIGKRLDMEPDVVLDAWGKLVIPGGIDPRDKYGVAVWRDKFVGQVNGREGGQRILCRVGWAAFSLCVAARVVSTTSQISFGSAN